MGGFNSTQDLDAMITDCITENWSIKRVKNLLSDLKLEPDVEKKLLDKVQVAKALKKSARAEEKRKPMLLEEKNKEEAETFEAGIRHLTEEAEKLEARARESEFENVPVKSLAPEPQQLEFFGKALLRISTKDDQRALEAIVKECLRLSISEFTIQEMLRLMANDNPDIKDAAEKIDHL